MRNLGDFFKFGEEELCDKISQKLMNTNLPKTEKKTQEILDTINHYHTNEETIYSLHTPMGYFESPNELRNYLKDPERKHDYYPTHAVNVVIENNRDEVVLLERREHRAIFGGWKTAGVFGKIEQETFFDTRENKVYSLPIDFKTSSLRELDEELRIKPRRIDKIEDRGSLIDIPMNYFIEVYFVKLKNDGFLNDGCINRKELIGISYVDKKKISKEKEMTPSSIAALEISYGTEIDAPYLENVTGDYLYAPLNTRNIFYPKFLPHTRPEIIENIGYEKLLELSKDSFRKLMK